MIMKCRCNLCGEEFRVNGYYNMISMQREHLQDNHSKEYTELDILRDKVVKVEKEVQEFEEKLFTDIE